MNAYAYKQNKNSSGDEIANVNFLTTISHTRRPTLKYRKRDKPTSFNENARILSAFENRLRAGFV